MVHVFYRIWFSHMNIQVLEVECLVSMAHYLFICLNNFLDFHIDKVIVGINMLFNQTFVLKKGWDQLPFFLHI